MANTSTPTTGQEVFFDAYYDMKSIFHTDDVEFRVYWIWQAGCYNLRVNKMGCEHWSCGFKTKEAAIENGRSYFPEESETAIA